MAIDTVSLAERELARLEFEIERLQSAVKCLIETKDAWAIIIRNARVNFESSSPTPKNAASLTAALPKEPQDEDEQPEAEGEYGGKIKFIKDIFIANPTRKFMPAIIWAMVQTANVSKRRGLVYQSLSRLHREGLLIKRQGKYFASPKLLAEENGEPESTGGPFPPVGSQMTM